MDTYDSIPNDEYLDDFGTSSSIVSMEDDVKSEAELMSAMLQAMKGWLIFEINRWMLQ